MEGQPRIGVLGAGALGLVSAYRLLKRGFAVTIYEREKVLGGLAAGFPVDGTYLDRFYHHLFRTDREAVALFDELGLGQNLRWLRPKTSLLHGGRPYQLDSPLAVLRFSPLNPLERLRLGMVVALLKVAPSQAPFEAHTADAWLSRWMGRRAHEVVWRPQLQGKFGERFADISMAWMWARLHDRTTQLGYPLGGFQSVYDRLGAEIERLGGEIRLGESVTGLAEAADGAIIVRTSAEARGFAQVLSTLPTRVTLKLTEGIPEDFRRRYEWGEAYGAHCAILSLDRQLLRDDTYWLSVADPGYPFMAVVEHTNMVPPAEYGGRHLVYLGNYLPMDAPLFKQSDEEVLAQYLPHLRKLNPAFTADWLRQSWVFKAPFAQPIVTREFPRHIAPHRTPLRNLWLASMFHVYPHDRGQNYSIALANKVAGQMAEEAAPAEPAGVRP
ncbi:MAG: NAD(P)/FAD-dependent oxidoreductase [Chloroflexota bacterium]